MKTPGQVQGSMFEALFERTLKPDGDFAAELREAGYDRHLPEASYSGDVFRKSLEIAWRYSCPKLSREEAMHRLGGQCASGFFETLIGKVMGVALPMVGAERIVQTLPKRFQAGGDATCKVEKVEEKFWKLWLPPGSNPHFIAGAVEVSLRRANVEPRVTVEDRAMTGDTLFIRW